MLVGISSNRFTGLFPSEHGKNLPLYAFCEFSVIKHSAEGGLTVVFLALNVFPNTCKLFILCVHVGQASNKTLLNDGTVSGPTELSN